MVYGLSVNEHGIPECEYCHEAHVTVRPRPVPGEEGIPLCGNCWLNVQQVQKRTP